MRKPAFCIYENKAADQLCGNRTADQRLCFRYTDSTIPLLPTVIRNFKPLAIFCGCKARFVSYLVGNSEARFSHNEAKITYVFCSRQIAAFEVCQNISTFCDLCNTAYLLKQSWIIVGLYKLYYIMLKYFDQHNDMQNNQ